MLAIAAMRWRGGGLAQSIAAVGVVDVVISFVVLVVLVVPALVGRGDGDVETALMKRLVGALPRPAAKLVSQDILLLRALILLLVRKPPAKVFPAAAHAGYARPILPLFIAATAIDVVLIVVLHLVIPHQGLRFAVGILGLMGLVWFLGFLASLLVYRHEVSSTGCRLRFSSWHDVRVVPLGPATLMLDERPCPVASADIVGDVLHVPVNGMTNTSFACSEGFRCESLTARLEAEHVRHVHFWADDPQSFLR